MRKSDHACGFYKLVDEIKKFMYADKRIDIAEIIAGCDRLFNSGNQAAVGEYLRKAFDEAQRAGDLAAQLTISNELLGHYRMSGDRENGLQMVSCALELVDKLDQRATVSGGTVLVNAATVLSAFGKAEEALALYSDAYAAYEPLLEEDDPLFAALFNNMASAYSAAGEIDTAGAYYLAAADILEKHGKLLDRATILVNIAGLGCNTEKYLDEAMACFDHPAAVRDGYYAHTAKKCAGAFGYAGQIERQKELEKRAEEIYERH